MSTNTAFAIFAVACGCILSLTAQGPAQSSASRSAPVGTVTRELPEGFVPVEGTAAHASGYPMQIRCERDGAVMVFVPGGEFASGLTDEQIDKLVRMVPAREQPTTQAVMRIEGLEKLKAGENLAREDLDDIANRHIQHQVTVLMLAELQAEGKVLPAEELDRWRRDGRTVKALLALPTVQKHADLSPQRAKEMTAAIEKMLPAGTRASTPEEIARAQFEAVRSRLREYFPVARKVRVAPFYIDKYEVTNRQYRKFFEQAGDPERRPGVFYGPSYNIGGPKNPKFYALWKDPKRNADDQPVTCVGEKDGLAYAKWAGKKVPSRDQWQRAAVGDGRRVFPWGNEFLPGSCKCAVALPSTQPAEDSAVGQALVSAEKIATTDSKFVKARETLKILIKLPAAVREIRASLQPAVPAKVGSFPKDASPYGCRDMAGNVSEWVVSRPGRIFRGPKLVVIGGNADTFDIKSLVPAQERSYEEPGKLVGFRTVLTLNEPAPQSRPSD